VVERWGRELDYESVFPLLALDGGRIGRGRHAAPAGPGAVARASVIGAIKWMLDPAFRGVGLGSLLVNHFIDTGRHNGLKHLNCMLISDLEADAIKVLSSSASARSPSPATARTRTATPRHDVDGPSSSSRT